MKLFEPFFHRLHKFLEKHTERLIDKDRGKLRYVPNVVIDLVFFLCFSVLLQFFADILLKILGYTGLILQMPWRTDFLFLTAISALMGYQTLVGMQRRELDVTRNSVQLGLLVETALVVGDIYFVVAYPELFPGLLYIRLPFLILTVLNFFILVFVAYRLKLFQYSSKKFSKSLSRKRRLERMMED